MLLGLLVAGFISSFQAHYPGQGGGAASLQSQGGIGWIVALLLARMIVIVPFQGEESKDAIDRELRSFLALPAWFGLGSLVDGVGGLLQRMSDQLVGRLGHGRVH